MMHTILLVIIIAISLFAAMIFASGQNINWVEFFISVFVIAAAIYFDRKITRTKLDNLEKRKAGNSLREDLQKLIVLCKKYSQNLTSDLGTLEEDFLQAIPDIENQRVSLINELGISNYTEIISVYAGGERKLNRGISAYIDGYKTEAKKYFEEAEKSFELCTNIIKKIKVKR